MLNKDQDHFSVAEPPKGAGPSARLLVCLDSYLKAKTEACRKAQIVLHSTTRRRNLTRVRKQIVHFAEPQAQVLSGQPHRGLLLWPSRKSSAIRGRRNRSRPSHEPRRKDLPQTA